MDIDKATLVQKVQVALMGGEAMQRKWCGFCTAHMSSSFKAEDQDEAFLLTFLDLANGDSIPPFTGEIPAEVSGVGAGGAAGGACGGASWGQSGAAGCGGAAGGDLGKGWGKDAGFKGWEKGWDKGCGGGWDGGKGAWDGGKGSWDGGKGSWDGGKGGGKMGRPIDPRKLFVGALPRSATEDSIAACLGNVGAINSIRLKYSEDGQCKGFAFCIFEDPSSVAKAIAASQAGLTVIDGKWIDCKAPDPVAENGGKIGGKGKVWDGGFGKGGGWDAWGGKGKGKGFGDSGGKGKGGGSGNDRKVFVGALPKAAGEEPIWVSFGQFGPIEKVLMKYDEMGNSRGFCFVEYSTVEGAQAAVAQCETGGIQVEGKWVQCRMAEGGKGKGEKGGGKFGGWDDWGAPPMKMARMEGWGDSGFKGKGKFDGGFGKGFPGMW